MNLKVLTFNIHKGLNVTNTRLILKKIANFLQEIDPDIVFLQEVQGEHGLNKARFIDWPTLPQTEYLAEHGWPYFSYGLNHAHEHGHHGNAVLSKFPVLDTFNTNISTHSISNRGLLYANIMMGKIKIHLLCTHFGLLKQEQVSQFELVNNFINTHIPNDESLILAGDFNDWRQRSLNLLSNSLGVKEVFHELHGKHAKTFPARLPLLRVDRIYYRGLVPVQGNVLRAKALSDHAPLLAEFQI